MTRDRAPDPGLSDEDLANRMPDPGLSDEDLANRMRVIASEIYSRSGRDPDDQPPRRADGGVETSQAARQIPDGPEVDVLARVWPLGSRLTALAGLVTIGYGALTLSSTGGLPAIVVGVALVGLALEIAKSEERQSNRQTDNR